MVLFFFFTQTWRRAINEDLKVTFSQNLLSATIRVSRLSVISAEMRKIIRPLLVFLLPLFKDFALNEVVLESSPMWCHQGHLTSFCPQNIIFTGR